MTTLFALARIAWFITRPKTRGVSACCVTTEGRIILVETTYEPGLNFPSGGLRVGEDAKAAIVRELTEEIGLVSFGIVTEVDTIIHYPNFKKDVETVFLIDEVQYSPRGHSLEIDKIVELELESHVEMLGREALNRLRLIELRNGQYWLQRMKDSASL